MALASSTIWVRRVSNRAPAPEIVKARTSPRSASTEASSAPNPDRLASGSLARSRIPMRRPTTSMRSIPKTRPTSSTTNRTPYIIEPRGCAARMRDASTPAGRSAEEDRLDPIAADRKHQLARRAVDEDQDDEPELHRPVVRPHDLAPEMLVRRPKAHVPPRRDEVLEAISARSSKTMWNEIRKKIVGGRTLWNSCLGLAQTLLT